MRDAGDAAHRLNAKTNPLATPMAPTFLGEMQRSAELGKNRGEIEANIAAIAAGALPIRGLGAFPMTARALSEAELYQQGRTAAQVERLIGPYEGQGGHYVPQRFTAGLPRPIRDNPFFVYKPAVSQYEFYRRHYQLDPKMHGARLPESGGWSGKAEGLSKFGLLDRLSFGMPAPTKGAVLINAADAGRSTFDLAESQDEP